MGKIIDAPEHPEFASLALAENFAQISDRLFDQIQDLVQRNKKDPLIEVIKDVDPADLASVLENLDLDDLKNFIRLSNISFHFDVLLELSDHRRQAMVQMIGIKTLAKRLHELDSDDAFCLIDELTAKQRHAILAMIPAAARASFEIVSAYPEDSAARLMQQELVAVPSFWKVGDLLKHFQKEKLLPDHFYEVYIINPKYKILGSVTLDKLLQHSSSMPLKDIMKQDIKKISASLGQEEVVYLFRRYHLVSAPVEDESGSIIGMITGDDVAEAMAEEAEKDIFQITGVGETDLTAPLLVTSSRRMGWLIVSLINALIAAFVINHYQATIEQIPSLAALMTIVAAMGSAAGTQVVTVTIRTFATRLFQTINPWKMFAKELSIAITNSLFFSVVLSLIVLLWLGDVKMALILPASLIFNMCWAAFGGVLFPFFIARFGLDPALSSGPLLGATTDILGFASFLWLAHMFII
ncbi:MAG: magnesium transporter [Alphaproteobacteria bacterium]